jgi:hypothetical protein
MRSCSRPSRAYDPSDPVSAWANFNRGLTLVMLGRYTDALAYLETARASWAQPAVMLETPPRSTHARPGQRIPSAPPLEAWSRGRVDASERHRGRARRCVTARPRLKSVLGGQGTYPGR